MTAHFDRNIFFVTSLTQTPLKIFISSHKILITFLSLRPQIVAFFLLLPNFPRQNPIFHFSQFFFISSFHPSKILMTFFSSLHIFVHHCTFCASLHVKTCPAPVPPNDVPATYSQY